MIGSFGDSATAKHYEGTKLHKKLNPQEQTRATFLLETMNAASNFEQLEKWGFPPSLKIQKLKGDLKDYFAIDIHRKSGWRIKFTWKGQAFHDVEITNYH